MERLGPAATADQHILLGSSQAGVAVDSVPRDCAEEQNYCVKKRDKSCVEFWTDDHEELKTYLDVPSWMYAMYCHMLDVLSLTLVWIAVALSHVDYEQV